MLCMQMLRVVLTWAVAEGAGALYTDVALLQTCAVVVCCR